MKFYVRMRSFMNRLHLSKAARTVYALVYNFTAEYGTCRASAEYFSANTGYTVRTIRAALRLLTDRGLIVNESIPGHRTQYTADLNPSERLDSDTQQTRNFTADFTAETPDIMNYNNKKLTPYSVIAPTIDEIRTAARKITARTDINPDTVSEKFFDTYSRQGWNTKAGRNILSIWRLKLSDWLMNERTASTERGYIGNPNHQKPHDKPQEMGSFDTDDFFAAAVARAYRSAAITA